MKIVAITPRQKTDALTSLIIEGMKDSEIEIIASDTGNGVNREYSDEDIVHHARDADYIFTFFGKSGGSQPHPKYYLLDRINMPDKSVYIDGSEWTSTGHADNNSQIMAQFNDNGPIHAQAFEAKFNSLRYRGEPWINEEMLLKCRWYFKRECYPEDSEKGIIPLPFGMLNSYFNPPRLFKDIDLFCAFGQKYTGLRFEVDDYCKNFASKKHTVCVGGSLSREEYRHYLSRCHVGVSAWGGGNCCMREWEIIASNACCFIQRPMIMMPDRPQDGIHWVEYSSVNEFSEKLDFYMNKIDECIKISNTGYNFAKEHHTGKARVKYMLDIMRGDKA